jgi:hypothetical protein
MNLASRRPDNELDLATEAKSKPEEMAFWQEAVAHGCLPNTIGRLTTLFSAPQRQRESHLALGRLPPEFRLPGLRRREQLARFCRENSCRRCRNRYNDNETQQRFLQQEVPSMRRFFPKLAVLLAVPVLLGVFAGTSAAQAVVVTPAPQVCYYPAPVTSYYVAPAVSFYAAPAVAYYAPPAVSFYSPPAVVAAPATSVTTYRYGVLPRRQVTTVTTFPAPVVTFYGR